VKAGAEKEASPGELPCSFAGYPAMPLTEQHDLRGGTTTWEDDAWDIPPSDPLPGIAFDIAVIGAGFMGPVLAERLSVDGFDPYRFHALATRAAWRR
jgi:hypothetical protein